MRRKKLYPGCAEAEKERSAYRKNYQKEEEPDFIGGKPNYDKFKGWTPEKVMVYLNID